MRKHTCWWAIGVVLAVGPLRAMERGVVEAHFDHFGGGMDSHAIAYTLTQRGGLGPAVVRDRSDARTGRGLGVRFGVWGDKPRWFGAGFDFSVLHIESPAVNAEAYPISFYMGARGTRLVSERFPNGRFQPYALLGISTVILRASVHRDALSAHLFKVFFPFIGGSDASQAVLSPYMVAGASWGLSPDWAIFAEWRRTDFHTTSETVNSIFWPTQHGTVSLSVRSDHYYVGLSRRFLNPPKKDSPPNN